MRLRTSTPQPGPRPVPSRKFTYGACGSGGAPCFYAWCCPMCALSTVIGRMHPKDNGAPICAGNAFGACCTHAIPCVGSVFFCADSVVARGAIRAKYGIPPAPVEDCLIVTLMPGAAAAQELAQLDLPTNSPLAPPKQLTMKDHI